MSNDLLLLRLVPFVQRFAKVGDLGNSLAVKEMIHLRDLETNKSTNRNFRTASLHVFVKIP